MKLLVLSDLHANWPALQAIQESADAVVCLGDLVSYGPFLQACVRWVRAHATSVIRGNHDTALACGGDPRLRAASWPMVDAPLGRHRLALTGDDVTWLRGVPTEARVPGGPSRIGAIHAAPRNHLFDWRLTPDLPEADLAAEVREAEADVLLLGHTHVAMCRRSEGTLVVNPGSVGQPLDGDPRASYAVLEDGKVAIRRVSYDIEATVSALQRLGLPEDVRRALSTTLRMGEPIGTGGPGRAGRIG